MVRVMSVEEWKSNPFGRPIYITRTIKEPFVNQLDWKELAPSLELFKLYLDRKGALKWGTKCFNSEYVPTYLKEIKASKAAKDRLNDLYRVKDSEEYNYSLLCHCKNFDLCHRSIVAGLLLGAGVPVADFTGKSLPQELIKYWDMYKKL